MGEVVYVPHECDPPGYAAQYLPGTEWQCPVCRALWIVRRFGGGGEGVTVEGACNMWDRMTYGRKVPRPAKSRPLGPDPADVLLARLMRAQRAWDAPGSHPRFHYRAQQRVRELMPLLAAALDDARGRSGGLTERKN